MRHRMSGHVLAAIYLFVDCIINIVVLWYVPSQLKVCKYKRIYVIYDNNTQGFFVEPSGEDNEDWEWMCELFKLISHSLSLPLLFK